MCLNNTTTTEIYPLSLHEALPISSRPSLRGRMEREGGAVHSTRRRRGFQLGRVYATCADAAAAGVRDGSAARGQRSEEHTSELQSRQYIVCRLLLEKITII